MAQSSIQQFLFVAVFLAVWFIVMRFVLPRLGVST
jgi:predicted secreted protein